MEPIGTMHCTSESTQKTGPDRIIMQTYLWDVGIKGKERGGCRQDSDFFTNYFSVNVALSVSRTVRKHDKPTLPLTAERAKTWLTA